MYSKESAESQETDPCVTLPVLSYGSKWITPYFQLYYTQIGPMGFAVFPLSF